MTGKINLFELRTRRFSFELKYLRVQMYNTLNASQTLSQVHIS